MQVRDGSQVPTTGQAKLRQECVVLVCCLLDCALDFYQLAMSRHQINLRLDEADKLFSLHRPPARRLNEGKTQRSDVLATLINKEWRFMADTFAACHRELPVEETHRLLVDSFGWQVDLAELRLYISYCGKPIREGDLYQFVWEIERTLHIKIKAVLVSEFGSEESGWWRKGIPEKVRIDCVQARERDQESLVEPYGYTTLVHLREILRDKWKYFYSELPSSVASSKEIFLSDLIKLNSIRNRVMHPVRGEVLNENDLRFVRGMRDKLSLSKWRKRIK